MIHTFLERHPACAQALCNMAALFDAKVLAGSPALGVDQCTRFIAERGLFEQAFTLRPFVQWSGGTGRALELTSPGVFAALL